MGGSTTSLIAVFWVRYSWGIRGVFVGYSWGIHMYRVCVGYVSGMYRECVETSEERKRALIQISCRKSANEGE